MDESPVTLNPHTEIQSNDEIEWMFEDKVIFKSKSRSNISQYVGGDERFKDNLELNNETGSLIINHNKTGVTGFYKFKITSSEGTSYRLFKVINGE